MAKGNKQRDKWLSLLSVLALIASWFFGGLKTNDSQTEFITYVSQKGDKVTEVSPQLYRIENEDFATSKWLSFGSGVGYGGEIVIGAVFSERGEVQTLAVLQSKETSSYFDKVVDEKLPESLLGQSVHKALYADGVTGATLTSQAYLVAADLAADQVRASLLDFRLTASTNGLTYVKWLDFAAVLFFIAAVVVNRSRWKLKNKLNIGLLAGSTALFGFHSASLYGATTIGGFIQGAWIAGVASYTPFILLALSLGYILYYNRNIYCQSLCPFGAAQQCLAKLGNAKATPLRHDVFVWFPRVLLLATLCLGLYFRNPAAFSYEPFGIAFGMIGGMYLFVLTVIIILTSLVIRRPWCQSLCPINAMTDFVVFNKAWLKQLSKARRKTRSREKA